MQHKSRPKVLFVLPSLVAGGAERMLLTYAGGIDHTRYESVFLSISGDGPLKSMITKNVQYERLNRPSVLWSLWPLYQKIKGVKPDIIVSTLPHMNFAVLFLSFFLPKAKYIVREAITPSYLLDKYGVAGVLIKFLYCTLFPRADIVLSPSQIILDELSQFLKQTSKFKVLHNPVDVASLQSDIEQAAFEKADTGIVNFLACGRLVHQKGFDRLIKACADLNISSDWHLTILGEGPDRDTLEELIKELGLEKKIELFGRVDKAAPYYECADCFLLPSRYEGLPNVVLESLACGTPVIATRESGGIHEIEAYTQGGDLRIVNDMSAFLKEMERVIPYTGDRPKKTLLPDHFKKERILKEFNALLDALR